MYILKNILLETGYSKENRQVKTTETKSFHLKISDGHIAEILNFENDLPKDVKTIDGKGYLSYLLSKNSTFILIRLIWVSLGVLA